MMFGTSVHFYMQLLWLYQKEEKMGKIDDIIKNFGFGLMEIYKGALFIGWS